MRSARSRAAVAGALSLLVLAGATACGSGQDIENRAKVERAKVDQVPVPDVHGRLEEQARNLLEALAFEVEVDTQPFPGYQRGRVVSQDPPAGSLVQRGSRVTLVVSGPRG